MRRNRRNLVTKKKQLRSRNKWTMASSNANFTSNYSVLATTDGIYFANNSSMWFKFDSTSKVY